MATDAQMPELLPCPCRGSDEMCPCQNRLHARSAVKAAEMPRANDAVSRLVKAARALGAMPEGYCFCSTNRIGDDSKAHEPECADLRAALVKMETEQCQVSIEPATGATLNGLHGSGSGAPDVVDNSRPDAEAWAALAQKGGE